MNDARREREAREDVWRAWMIAAQAGDRDAFEKLLLELLPVARRQVARRVADPSAREDIVQSALVSLFRARHTYRGSRPFAPWFHAVVRNALVDALRARARRGARERSLEAEGVPEPSVPPAHPGEDALSPELASALAALPPAQREAVELIHVDGLSVAEAAERAGVSVSALKVRAHRGYRAMRARLGDRKR
jgi:RNA polymerase sigma-70 factor (ECF subfamily)